MHVVWVWIRKAQGTVTVLDGARISQEKRHFGGNGNTWANSNLSAVDSIHLIHNAAAAMWPLATTFITICLFCSFSGKLTVYRAVLGSGLQLRIDVSMHKHIPIHTYINKYVLSLVHRLSALEK